jgi:ribose/xylose/arabinose/galactoside ABC-type transport system permease subunit
VPQRTPQPLRNPGLPDAGLRGLLLSEHFVLSLCLLYFLTLWALLPHMASPYNLASILSSLGPLLVLVIGQMFVLIVAGIDLSQTSILAVTSVIGGLITSTALDPELFSKSPLWGTLISEEGGVLAGSPLATPVAVVVMLFTGVAIGLLNGLAVARLRMPPFMVTLVSMIFFSGLAVFLTRSENIGRLPEAYTLLGQGGLGTFPGTGLPLVPWSLSIAAALAFGAHLLLNRTVLGRWLYATGQNIKVARVSGVPTARVVVLAYAASGLCAAVGSILYSARLGGGRPTLGEKDLLNIVGAAVIGGISLFGGRGSVLCAIYGALFFTLLAASLDMVIDELQLPVYVSGIVKGVVIAAAAALDVARTRLLARGASGGGAERG